MLRAIETAAVVVLLAGCAGVPRRGDAALDRYQPYAGPPVEQFHFYQLDSWQAVAADRVVIWTDPFTAYLVRVRTPCTELAFTERLGVTSTLNTVSRLESVVPSHQNRCPIEEIQPIDLKAMKADQAARRAAEQAARPTGPR
jgi:hypothetical protein